MKNLKEIDVEDVMNRLSNNKDLCIVLLKKFYNQYNNSHFLIEDLLIKNKVEEAYKLLHTIKGVSGNLGMKYINKTSGLLCEQIQYGNCESTSDTFAIFKKNFINVLYEIEQL